jgi:hypothetical protein
MGNGALPNGPSYRAHPRLYRKPYQSPARAVIGRNRKADRTPQVSSHPHRLPLLVAAKYAPVQPVWIVPSLEGVVEFRGSGDNDIAPARPEAQPEQDAPAHQAKDRDEVEKDRNHGRRSGLAWGMPH